MQTQKGYSIIILTYNSEDFIESNLDSIIENWPKRQKKEILIIDNHSKDRTVQKVKKYKKNIKLFEIKENKGFAKGINFGIKKSKYSKIIILNPDTKILPSTIKNLFKCEDSSGAQIIGGKAKKINGGIHNTCVRYPTLATILFDYTNLRKLIPGDFFHKKHYYLDFKRRKNTEVDVISGCFMLIDKKVFKKIGLFDENFFMYLEDIDFCLRAKRNGFKIYYCNDSEIIHHGGDSSKNPDKIHHRAWVKSRRYYCFKHFSFFKNLLLQPILFFDSLLIQSRAKTKNENLNS